MALFQDLQALSRTRFFRNVALTALAGAALFLVFERFVIYPEFSQYLISITEDDARRVASHLALKTLADKSVLSTDSLPQTFVTESKEILTTLGLKKLKLFSPDGEIIHSTDPVDIGMRNKKTYFHQQVARGQQFTKVVQKETQTAEGEFATADVVETYVPLLMPNGRFAGAFEIYYDISDRWTNLQQIMKLSFIGVTAAVSILLVALFASLTRAASAFQEREKAFLRIQLASKIMANAKEGVVVTDTQGRIESVNRAFTEITGYAEQEVLGKATRILQSGRHGPDFFAAMWDSIVGNGFWQGEIWNRHKSGDVYPEWLTITAIKNPNNMVTNYVGIFLDISHFKHKESRLATLAYRDALTELPNRLLTQDRLEQYIASAKRRNAKVAVLFLDLDGFKRINDRFGHNVGDSLLQEVARRFKTCIREEDTLGRLGGDEFIVVLQSGKHPEEAEFVARRLIEVVKDNAIEIDCHKCEVGVSVGISLFPDHSSNGAELIKHADTAMYVAKTAGKGRLAFYSV